MVNYTISRNGSLLKHLFYKCKILYAEFIYPFPLGHEGRSVLTEVQTSLSPIPLQEFWLVWDEDKLMLRRSPAREMATNETYFLNPSLSHPHYAMLFVSATKVSFQKNTFKISKYSLSKSLYSEQIFSSYLLCQHMLMLFLSLSFSPLTHSPINLLHFPIPMNSSEWKCIYTLFYLLNFYVLHSFHVA